MNVYLVTWTEFGRGDEPIGIFTTADMAMVAVDRHRKHSRVVWDEPWKWCWFNAQGIGSYRAGPGIGNGRLACFRWAESPPGWPGHPRRHQYMVTRFELDAT